MGAHTLIFRDIAMVFTAALVCGLLAWRLRQPLVLGYVLAGLILSPFTPGLRVHDVHTFEIMAEIGVILLMFSVGIEFSIPDLLRVKCVALAGAPLGILLSIALGVGAGMLMGWPFLQGIAVGSISIAAITEAIGLSLALGAFLAGLLLGSSEFAHKMAQQTLPIRDAFVALFFVTVGMLIDPSTWLASWRVLALLVGLILVGKFLIWTGVVRIFAYSWQTAVKVGVGLTQIGEFSFILAQVALHAGLITSEIYNATLAASLVTILANATLFKFVPQAGPAKTLAAA